MYPKSNKVFGDNFLSDKPLLKGGNPCALHLVCDPHRIMKRIGRARACRCANPTTRKSCKFKDSRAAIPLPPLLMKSTAIRHAPLSMHIPLP